VGAGVSSAADEDSSPVEEVACALLAVTLLLHAQSVDLGRAPVNK